MTVHFSTHNTGFARFGHTIFGQNVRRFRIWGLGLRTGPVATVMELIPSKDEHGMWVIEGRRNRRGIYNLLAWHLLSSLRREEFLSLNIYGGRNRRMTCIYRFFFIALTQKFVLDC